jgi:hypothetical protein
MKTGTTYKPRIFNDGPLKIIIDIFIIIVFFDFINSI